MCACVRASGEVNRKPYQQKWICLKTYRIISKRYVKRIAYTFINNLTITNCYCLHAECIMVCVCVCVAFHNDPASRSFNAQHRRFRLSAYIRMCTQRCYYTPTTQRRVSTVYYCMINKPATTRCDNDALLAQIAFRPFMCPKQILYHVYTISCA